MNGAEALVHTLLKSGIDTVFANPGTSEMHFVAALDRIAGLHCVPQSAPPQIHQRAHPCIEANTLLTTEWAKSKPGSALRLQYDQKERECNARVDQEIADFHELIEARKR